MEEEKMVPKDGQQVQVVIVELLQVNWIDLSGSMPLE
jgi:hypothetical protein